MRRRDEQFPDNGFEAWGGYMNAKKAKLEEQYSARAGNEVKKLSNIFCGVSIFVNGYTIPSADELKALMASHGGVYHTYQRTDDFIIASNLPDTKVKKMSLAKVVKPEWITDSIASNRLLDYREYLLYRNSRAQQTLNFKIPKTDSDDNLKEEYSCDQDSSVRSVTNAEALKTETNIDVSVDEKPIKRTEDSSEDKTIVAASSHAASSGHIKEAMTKTAADPNFISEFYNNSRLHHISQLGATFKQYVNDLRENSDFVFPMRKSLKERIGALNGTTNLSPLTFERGKTIMHIDMDCFFVSVGLRKRPELRGMPIAVTHSKGGQGRPKRPGVDRNTEFNLYRQKQAQKICKATGKPESEVEFESRVDNITDEDDKYGSMSEIASCSYEARAKGISNGMFMGAALRLCPDLQTIPYDFDGYKEVAYDLYNTVAQYTLDIEAVSCDEMYVDCTELLKDLGVNAQEFATAIRNEIKEKTGCPCSTGFGGNRLQARLATKKAKPDGQFFLTAELVEDFMYEIKLRDLPGVGRQISQKLEALGHQTCGSLQSLTLASLKCHLGVKTGAQLFDQCRGRDLNPLCFHTVRKSVSAEVNYGIRFENESQCIEFLKQLSAEVHSRMQQFKVVGKCITLKLMVRAADAPVETAKFMGHGFCDVINKSTSLNNAMNDLDVITREVLAICKKQNVDPKELRGVGIQITKLESLVSNKQTVGAINKFLVVGKPAKHENTSRSNHLSDSTENKLKVNIKIEAPRTPTKAQNKISPKKSPILGIIKSPIVKKRGRPPKNSKPQVSTSKNLMNKFLQGQSLVRDIPYRDPMIKEFIEPPKEPLVVPNKVETAVRTEGLSGLPWEKVRELLRAWLDSGQTPLPYDVRMLVEYMQEMVVNKNIDKLNILLNFLRRRTRELESKEWLEVYNKVVEQVQNAMIAVYGKRLWIED
ncbi:impB/mucB/samB family domain-containing protein [Phthorimaea operculella]|nr:impB/mucB/samB family domain-containing protein [Phthorimaea operculella]